MVASANAHRLEIAVSTSLAVGGIPTEKDVSDLAESLRKIPIYQVSDEEFNQVIKKLHARLTIDMGLGSCVYDDHNPWLHARKAKIAPFYWSRYHTDLVSQGWSPRVVNSLDKVTDEILDLLGDPRGSSGWPRRGLVMGDVQSGKTSNYTGLICKAADAGYKLIILLTGTLESLRRQTQERLDSGFVGVDSSGIVNNRSVQRKGIGVGLIDGTRAAGVFTSTLQDFRAETVNQLGFRLRDYNEPVLLVVKKNTNILENLRQWLVNFNVDNTGSIDLPLLLIDDEADNASINTNPVKATAINSGIRKLLKLFPRSSYVGFTATPFANVFINPESTEAMEGDDLFPRDFIYALDAPSNYFGANRIFGENSEISCIEPIDDAESFFPPAQKSDDYVLGIPESLMGALNSFLIVNAIMDLRFDMPKHRSMLVNVSHYTLIQNQVRDILDSAIRLIQNDVQNYANLPEYEALQNGSLRALKTLYDERYSDHGVTWAKVQAALPAAILPIQVSAVNQRSGPASLDYRAYKEHGLRVIAVGGNSLARGLTLEGLCISYFYRSTKMYDALLQMGRWFGYRNGYEDLCKIWMTDDTADWYSHISVATDELRSEVRRMQLSRLKPIDFGLRVRSHPEALMITARNKMRNSDEVTEIISIDQESLESTRLLSDSHVVLSNYRAAQELCANLLPIKQCEDYQFPVWRKIPKALVVEFLRRFVGHPISVKFQTSSLADFIEKSEDSKLDEWDVAIPSGEGGKFELVPGLPADKRKRYIGVDEETRALLINGSKLRVGSAADEKIGLTKTQVLQAESDFRALPENQDKRSVPGKAYCALRTSPLLLLHLVSPKDSAYVLPEGCDALVAVGLSFPSLNAASQRISYRINLVELRNMLSGQSSGGAADDEDEDDE